MPLFELKQHYEDKTPEWKAPAFKDCVAAEIKSTFFNADEHAELHSIDGIDALVILEEENLREHAAHWEAGAKQNFDTGLYTAHTILYIRVEDYGEMPVIGNLLTVDEGTENERQFFIKNCEDESGIYRITMERTRQG